MRKALWVVRDRITSAHAIDDVLADASTRGIFDLVVEVGDDGDALERLVRFGAAVGVRIHAWGVHDVVARYPAEGMHFYRPEIALARAAATRLRQERPGIVISAGVPPEEVAHAQGWVDVLCPMAYREDTGEVERLLGAARAAAPRTEMWGGLMAYPGEHARLRGQVRAAARAGCEGAILFAYDPKTPDLLDIFAAA